MRAFRFTYEDDDDFGPGFVPDWIEDANPSQGMGAAHDVLEHFPNCIGGFEGELMAFGSLIFVRGEHYQPLNRHLWNVYDGISSDIQYFLPTVLYGEQTLRDPGAFRASEVTDEGMNLPLLRVSVSAGVRIAIEHQVYGDQTVESIRATLPGDAERRIVGWIVKGYRKARLRFKRADLPEWRACELFETIASEFDQALKEEGSPGDEITVKVDLRNRSVDVRRTTWEDRMEMSEAD